MINITRASTALPLLGAAGIGLAGAAKAAPPPDKPNVLIIYCDQLAAWTLGCYGGTEIGTPNIDRLAHEGVTMTEFYVNTPVSTPSRGCWQTGLYPTEHGAFKNDKQIRQDIPTFASELRDNGYATGYAGKWHLDGNPKRPGWDLRGEDMGWSDRSAMYSFGHYKTIDYGPEQYPVMTNEVSHDPKTYPTDWFTDRAIEFIDKHKEGSFCYMLSIPDPHGPYLARDPYREMYPPETMKMPETLLHEPKSDHYWYHQSRSQAVKKDASRTEYDRIVEELPVNKSEYFAMIKCIDDNVGRLIDYLVENGLYDNTIIIFSADHGDMMGSHGRMAKAVPFDESARVPFVVRYPASLKAGTRVDNVASAIDFFPTVLSLTGVDTEVRVSGKDMTPVLKGQGKGWDDAAFLRCYTQAYPWVGVVTPDYKLIYGKEDIGGRPLLIDRKKDPTESYNCVSDPQYAAVVKELSQRIGVYCREHEDTHWTWLQKRIK